MSRGKLFIGTISTAEAEVTISDVPWQPQQYDVLPYPSVLTEPHGYLTALGSGCYPSMATVSPQGVWYNSAIDVFRQDYEDGRIVIDVDHIVAGHRQGYYSVYNDPTIQYHHLLPEDEIVSYLEPAWRYYIRDNLGRTL